MEKTYQRWQRTHSGAVILGNALSQAHLECQEHRDSRAIQEADRLEVEQKVDSIRCMPMRPLHHDSHKLT